MKLNFCPGCASAIQQDSKYCSQCGFDLNRLTGSKKSIPTNAWLSIIGITIVVFSFLWFFQGYVIGRGPQQAHTFPLASPAPDYLTDEIRALKSDVDKNPTDLEALRVYSTSLWNKLSDYDTPPQQLIFDLIEVLGGILKVAPEEPQALLMMANISFNQKIFDKAVSYYQRYLSNNKDDHEARSSYASALAFMGKHNDALIELDTVLKTNPNYFQAVAYKAITLAQVGRTKEALELGNKAIAISPNDEARARFGGFLDSLKSNPSNPLDDFIKSHQIAGPKFVKSSYKNNTATLVFKDFPMSAMPQFAKDAFVAKVKIEAAKVKDLVEVIFIEEATGNEMHRVRIN